MNIITKLLLRNSKGIYYVAATVCTIIGTATKVAIDVKRIKEFNKKKENGVGI